MLVEEFYLLLGHELRGAKRYRRFVSVVLAGGPNGENLEVLFRNSLRESDEMCMWDRRALLLLSETDASSAEIALKRMVKKNGALSSMRFAIATYPTDGQETGAILRMALSRFERSGQRV